MATGVPTATVNDALAARHFAVEIDGTQIAQFTELSGITSEMDVVELKENSKEGKPIIKKLPGSRKAPTITLKRAKNVSMDLYNWHKDMLDGKVTKARKNGSIIFYDYEFGEVARWNFENGWVSKLTTSTLKAGSNEVITEEATIVAENLERVK
jgi:phage tail-like protein